MVGVFTPWKVANLTGGSAVKNLPAVPETQVQFWVGKISWRRKWQPTIVFLPGKSHGQRNWWATVHEAANVGHSTNYTKAFQSLASSLSSETDLQLSVSRSVTFNTLRPHGLYIACQAPFVHGILQVRILVWVAIPFSIGYSWTRDWTQVSGRFFTVWTIWEAHLQWSLWVNGKDTMSPVSPLKTLLSESPLGQGVSEERDRPGPRVIINRGHQVGSGRQASDLLHLGLWVGVFLKGKSKETGIDHCFVTFLNRTFRGQDSLVYDSLARWSVAQGSVSSPETTRVCIWQQPQCVNEVLTTMVLVI